MSIKFKQGLAKSFETIAHQYDRSLFLKLVDGFDRLRSGIDNKESREKALDDILAATWDHSGVNVKLRIYNSNYLNASTGVLDFKNSPLWTDADFAMSGDYAGKFVEKNAKVDQLHGMIDLAKGKVSGLFSKLQVSINISYPMLLSKHLKAEEIAAIYAHELGHQVTFFVTMACYIKTNHAIRSVRQRLEGMHDTTIRYKLLTEFENANRIAIPNKQQIAEGLDATLFVFKAYQEKYRNEYGCEIYDQRSSEYLADQYVARIGGAKALANALTNLNRMGAPHRSYVSPAAHFFSELVKITWSTMFLHLPVIILACMGDPLHRGETEYYDRPGERLKRIKHQAVDSLKRKDLDKEDRQRIVRDIAVIESLEALTKDKNTAWEAVYGFIFPWARKVRKDINEQKLLEELGNNGLFVSAAKLKDLT